MINKKADSKVLSMWWFLVLIIIAVGVMAGVMIFYAKKVDVRLLEADLMSKKLYDCLAAYGIVNQEFLNGRDLFDICYLDKEVVMNSGRYFIKIELLDLQGNNLFSAKKYGNSAFEEDCNVGNSFIDAPKYPKCSIDSIKVYFNGEIVKLNIISGSNTEYRPIE